MRTGSEAIAPSSAARWEIDLSGGARSSPVSPRRGLEAHVHRARLMPAPPGSRARRSAPRRAPACSSPPIHSATTPWRLSSEGDRAMSRMLTPAPPSASAISAITPGRLGTEARSSLHRAAGQARAEQRLAVGARALVPGGDGRRVARRKRRAHLAQRPGELVDAGDQRVAVGHVDVGPDRAVGAGHARGVAEARADRRQAPLLLAAASVLAAWATSRLASTCGRCETHAIRRSWVSGVDRRRARAERRQQAVQALVEHARRCCPGPASGTRWRRRTGPRARARRPPSRRPASGWPPMKRSSAPASATTRAWSSRRR